MAKLISRRQAVSTALWSVPLLAVPGIAGSSIAGSASASVACPSTAAQSEGPFYPVTPFETRSNLIRTTGSAGRPQGRPIIVTGRLTDIGCNPLANAEVQLWQADAQGRYNHPGESSGKPLDAGFLYWGKAKTDSQGNYRFVTILPAAYSVGGSWMRPPHIHFKFRAGGAGGLTTQMYFPGQALNDRDYLLQRVSRGSRGALIARQDSSGSGNAAGLPVYRFDVAV